MLKFFALIFILGGISYVLSKYKIKTADLVVKAVIVILLFIFVLNAILSYTSNTTDRKQSLNKTNEERSLIYNVANNTNNHHSLSKESDYFINYATMKCKQLEFNESKKCYATEISAAKQASEEYYQKIEKDLQSK